MLASLSALGESHPLTLRAMFNLAFSKRGLGESYDAVELMSRCAEVSSAVLGDDHPETRVRHELLAEWLAVDAQRIEDVDVSGFQNMRGS
jgi:hypothetical protein